MLNLDSLLMRKILITIIVLFLSLVGYGQETSMSGQWTQKSYDINGSWSIVKTGESFKLILDEKFKTKDAPDLKIFLSKKEAGTVTSKNATKDAVLISPLKKSSGKQEYEIKENIDLSAYKTILIHCEQYTVLWGVSNLSN